MPRFHVARTASFGRTHRFAHKTAAVTTLGLVVSALALVTGADVAMAEQPNLNAHAIADTAHKSPREWQATSQPAADGITVVKGDGIRR